MSPAAFRIEPSAFSLLDANDFPLIILIERRLVLTVLLREILRQVDSL
jgi:hypothetical protein